MDKAKYDHFVYLHSGPSKDSKSVPAMGTGELLHLATCVGVEATVAVETIAALFSSELWKTAFLSDHMNPFRAKAILLRFLLASDFSEVTASS